MSEEKDAIAPEKEPEQTQADKTQQPLPEAALEPPEPADQDQGQDSDRDLVAALQEKLEAAEKQASENWDVAVRVKADMENLKKRTLRDVSNAHKFALEKLATELLAVCDAMELGLQADNADAEKLMEGTQLTCEMLINAMARFNITQVDPMGEKFDPDFHQAVTMQPSEECDPNTVIQVMQKGYMLHDRLLRPALVVVSQNQPG